MSSRRTPLPGLARRLCREIARSYDWLEQHFEPGAGIDIGQISLATALSWLEFRELPTFRPRLRLIRWSDEFSNRTSMRATLLRGQTHD